MRISDWSSDVCSSDLKKDRGTAGLAVRAGAERIDRHRSGDPQYLLMRAGRAPSDNFAQNRQQGSAPIRKAVLPPARPDRIGLAVDEATMLQLFQLAAADARGHGAATRAVLPPRGRVSWGDRVCQNVEISAG